MLAALVMIIGTSGSAVARESEVPASAGIVVAALTAAALVELVKEQMEHDAVEWMLANRADVDEFELTLLDWSANSFSDLSSTSAVLFSVRPKSKPQFILMVTTDHGWVTESGVNFAKVRYHSIARSRWDAIMFGYLRVSAQAPIGSPSRINVSPKRSKSSESAPSGDGDFATIDRFVLVQRQLAYFDVGGECRTLALEKISEDSYRVGMDDADFKVVYSENALHMFVKADRSLVKISRKTLGKIAFEFADENVKCDPLSGD
jgi:hypothetical protein